MDEPQQIHINQFPHCCGSYMFTLLLNSSIVIQEQGISLSELGLASHKNGAECYTTSKSRTVCVSQPFSCSVL